jgi:hypothetical protein
VLVSLHLSRAILRRIRVNYVWVRAGVGWACGQSLSVCGHPLFSLPLRAAVPPHI